MIIKLIPVLLAASLSFGQSIVPNLRTETLQHFFQNLDIDSIGDAAGLQNSTTADSFFIALYSSDPSAGNQSTNEISYTGYARKGVARSSTRWTVSNDSAWNTDTIVFGTCTSGSASVTHAGAGSYVIGDGKLLFVNTCTNMTITTTTNAIPRIPAKQLVFTLR